MSEDKLEILRSSVEAFNRRDRETWLSWNEPEAELLADPDWPESETVRGREAVWDFLVSVVDAWEQAPVEEVEVIAAGDDRLVARFTQTARGKASGVQTEFDYWWVGTFRDGRILRHLWFSNRATALEAAGLSQSNRS